MVGRLLVNTVLILCVEFPISDPLNEDLELGTNVDIETSPTPAPIEENKSNNDINYMTFFLNSERMPIQKSADKKTPKKRQTGGIRKPRLTVKSKSSLGIKTAKSPRGKKPSVKNYLEKFEKELVLKKEMFEDRTSMIDGFLVTKLHTLDDSDGDVPHQGQESDTINGNTSTSPIKSQGKTSIAGKTSKVRKSRSGPINSELLGVPLLEYGWWREIVYRRVSGNSVADVYYHSPQPFSKKFRSKVQISDEREYLMKNILLTHLIILLTHL